MLRWFLRRMIAKFEQQFDYDASYADDLIDYAPIALLWLFLGPRIVRRPRELPLEAWVAAGLVGAMEADCGPCTQLGVRWAQKMGVNDDTLRAIITGYEDAMSEDVRLATRYTRAALRHDIDAEGFRAEIEQRWGKNVLVRLAYVITISGLFPTIKYALGYGQACTRVRIGERDVVVHRAIPEVAL